MLNTVVRSQLRPYGMIFTKKEMYKKPEMHISEFLYTIT